VKWVGVGWVGKLKVCQVVGRAISASQLSYSSASMTSSSLCVGLWQEEVGDEGVGEGFWVMVGWSVVSVSLLVSGGQDLGTLSGSVWAGASARFFHWKAGQVRMSMAGM